VLVILWLTVLGCADKLSVEEDKLTVPTEGPPPVTSESLEPTQVGTMRRLRVEVLGVPGSYSDAITHRIIKDLESWHGRIYIGHGDWGANTGPVRAMYFDVGLGELVHDEAFLFDDESIDDFRSFGEVLIAPGTDAREGWEFGNLYLKQWGESWHKLRTVPGGLHVFDAALTPDKLVVSSSDETAQGHIWTSQDQGRTWTHSREIPGEGKSDFRQSLTSFFILSGGTYAITPHQGCFRLDGVEWLELKCLPNGISDVVIEPEVFSGVAVFRPYYGGRSLYLFDGSKAFQVKFEGYVKDIAVTSSEIWILVGNEIYGSSAWTCFCAADFSLEASLELERGIAAGTLANVDGTFYFGLSSGELARGLIEP